MFSLEEINKIIEKYKRILHLEEWIIKVELVSQNDLKRFFPNENEIVYGCIVMEENTRIATMYIGKDEIDNTENVTLTAIVVHELIHLLLKPLTNYLKMMAVNINDEAIKNLFLYFTDHDTEIVINRITRVVIEQAHDNYYLQKNKKIDEVFESVQNKNNIKNHQEDNI